MVEAAAWPRGGWGMRRALTRVLGAPAPARVLKRAMDPYALRVVCYHSVADHHPFLPRHLYVTPAGFRAQMAHLARVFNVVALSRLEEVRERRVRHPLAVTFDDGLADGHDAALPILAELGLPATFYLSAQPYAPRPEPLWTHTVYQLAAALGARAVAAALDVPSAADASDATALVRALRPYAADPALHRRLARLRAEHVAGDGEPRYLDAEMVGRMRAAGMEIGAHGHTHHDLSRCADLEVECERARAIVEGVAGTEVHTFAYPFGDPDSFDARTQAHVRRVFAAACTTLPRVNPRAALGAGLIHRVCAYEMPAEKLTLKLLLGI
ncbi:MAG TPA: polysaccharide deacetylase family protein [Longimicrobium sp.]